MSDTPIYGQCVHGNNLATCVHCRYGDNNTMMSGTQIMKVLEGRDARLSSTEADVVIGYKLTRADCSGWMFCGTTPSEVAECVKNELDMHDGLSPDECGGITIEAYETTQAEIDNLPEFQGW